MLRPSTVLFFAVLAACRQTPTESPRLPPVQDQAPSDESAHVRSIGVGNQPGIFAYRDLARRRLEAVGKFPDGAVVTRPMGPPHGP